MESARCNARTVIAESQRKRLVSESTRSIVHRAWTGVRCAVCEVVTTDSDRQSYCVG